MIAWHLLERRYARVELTGERMDLEWAGLPNEEAAEPDLYLSPGWLDVQVNGFGGHDMNSPAVTPADVSAITRRLWREGVTAWCPTVVSADSEQIEHALSVVRQAAEQDEMTQACAAGIHLEGPYISAEDGARGAHNAAAIHPPDWDEFTRWQAAAGGRIRIVTLAPEQPGAIEFIRRLAGSGVIPALGHTHASTDQIRQAAAAGARLSTHLGNGIAARLARHPNPIWDQLAEDGLAASLILDGFHLPGNTIRVMLRAKGLQRCLLVSDATALAGQPPGIYTTPIGGQVQLHPNGRLALLGSDYLAGAAASLKTGVENALLLGGCSLAEAVGLAAQNPARLLGYRQDSAILFSRDAYSGAITIRAAAVNGRVVGLFPPPPGMPAESR